ncbi:MAG: glyceraldehyde-3-phosphate dehydrogenase [Pseudomonadota bacterium]
MTTRIAIALFALIVVFLVGDFAANGGDWSLFLTKKFLELIEWLKFWR